MTSAHKPVFLVVSQNQDVAELVKEILSSNDVIVKTSQPENIDKFKTTKIHYIIFLISRDSSAQNTTSFLINLYNLAKTLQSKIAIVDIYQNEIQPETVERTLQLLNQISNDSPLFRYIVTKDLFQDHPSNIFPLEQKIEAVLSSQKIEISSKGENLIHPLNLKDLIAAVLKSLFLDRTAGKKLTVIGDPLKDLELAYIIKDELEKIGQSLNIDAIKKDEISSLSILNASAKSRAVLKWLPSDTNEDKLRRKISVIASQPSAYQAPVLKKQPLSIDTKSDQLKKKIFFPKFKPLKIKPLKPKLPEPEIEKPQLHKTERKFLISIPVILISISLFSFLAISVIYAFLLSTSLKKTKNSLNYLNQGDTAKVSQEIQKASQYLQAGEDLSRYILPVYQFGSSKLATNINNFSSLLKHSQSTIQSINESYQLANNLYHDLFTQSGVSSAADISIAIQARLRTIHQELSQIQIISQNHTFPTFFNQKLEEIDFAQKINTLSSQTAQSLKLLEAFSTLLSNPKSQHFALLVQDPNELKGSGGTIRALVLANIENQKITNIRLIPPGQIDQQMIGQIPASPVIESLTGQAGLSFTNSNTSASFIKTSLLVDKFLKNSINFKSDLIIGVTTQVFEDIIKEIGSLNTSSLVFTPGSFNQQLVESSLNHSASQTTIVLLEKLVEDLQTQTLPLIKLVRPVINTLTQDNLRIWFRDPAKENSVVNYSLAGNIFLSACNPLLNPSNCSTDVAYLAENNLSVAPFNFYQKRNLQHQVTIQGQSVLHTFILNYQYESVPKEINRDYQALYQIYLHPKAQFVSLEKNNQKIDATVDQESYGDLSLFQIPLSHTPQGTVLVKISFIVKDLLPTTNPQNFAYSLKIYHQPGTNIQDSQLIINYPSDLAVSGITSPATIGSGKIIYQPVTDLSLNSAFGIQFASQP